MESSHLSSRQVRWHFAVPMLLSAATLCIVFFGKGLTKGYEWTPILPLAYGMLSLSFPKLHIYSKSFIGIRVFSITLFIRYVALPFMLVLSSDFGGVGTDPSSDSVRAGILIMLYEMVISFAVIHFLGRIFYEKNGTIIEREEKQHDNGKLNIVYWLLIIYCIFSVGQHPDLLNNFQFFSIDETRTSVITYFRGLDTRALIVAKSVVFIMLAASAKRRHRAAYSPLPFLIACIAAVLYIGIFSGENRTNIVVDAVCALTVLRISFPEKKKKIGLIISIACLCVIVSVTIYRNFTPHPWNQDSPDTGFSIGGITRTIQLYVSGPRNMGLAVETQRSFRSIITAETFRNDMLIWSGYMAGFVEGQELNTTVSMFNNVVHYGPAWTGWIDQIIPMSGQGYCYFGFFGAPIFMLISLLFLMWFDKLAYKSHNLAGILMYTNLACRFGLVMGLNVTIMMMFIFDRFLQLWLVVYFNNIVKVYGGNKSSGSS